MDLGDGMEEMIGDELNDIQKDNILDDKDLLEENEQDSDSSDSNNDKRFPVEEETDWIHWFCKLRGNEFFIEIDPDFIKKEENLSGIKYKEYLKILLSSTSPKDTSLNQELIEELQEVREIYGYIHKRFLNTPLGLGLVREKFINGIYGYCPRILCNKQVLLPIGLSEDIRYSQVKVFCPMCQEVYKPRERFYGYGGSDKRIYKFSLPDGIFFGTSFPQNFLMHFPDLDPRINEPLRYIPKLYGFRIFGKYGSKYYSENKEDMKKKCIKVGIISS